MTTPASDLRHIRVLSDGRPGHENQSVGLALALARRTGATYEVVKLDPVANVVKRMRAAAAGEVKADLVNRPDHGQDARATFTDLVIAAGHRTHLPLWWAARKLRARSVVIMKPSLPLACFDLALVPRHDVGIGKVDTERRVLTRGAINRVPEALPLKAAVGLVLIGGPSKHHGWDGQRLAVQIAEVLAAQPELEWTVADSRRTPEGFLASLALPVELRTKKVQHQQTVPGWLAEELARSQIVWVTEDSVSMVHEAVTAGAATGVLWAPALRENSRTGRALNGLFEAGLAVRFPALPRAATGRFHETGRCADLIIERWFNLNGKDPS